MSQLIYLASPYTHDNFAVREARFCEAVFCCGWFMNHLPDSHFYSPIAHTHTIAIRCRLPGEWQYWAAFDEYIISRCNELWVLTVPGWSKSTGVSAELKLAQKYHLPIRYIILHPEQPSDSVSRYEVVDEPPTDPYQPQYFS